MGLGFRPQSLGLGEYVTAGQEAGDAAAGERRSFGRVSPSSSPL